MAKRISALDEIINIKNEMVYNINNFNKNYINLKFI